MALIVLGLLRASSWGFLEPRSSPVEPLGFSLTPFVVAAGVVCMWAFVRWERRREAQGRDPLVRLALLRIPALRSGLASFAAQNFVLMGVFFVVPLYLQLVLGLDALDTGLRMLPVSVAMFVTSLAGSRLAARFAARWLVRLGLLVALVSILTLIGTIEPELDSGSFKLSMALLGVGMGLIASQLGNVVQSAVGAGDRSEAGGLQYTLQQLGSALGVALVGAIVLTGLIQHWVGTVEDDPRLSDVTVEAVQLTVDGEVSFVPADTVAAGAEAAGLAERRGRRGGRGVRGRPAPRAEGRAAVRGVRRGRRAPRHRGPAGVAPRRARRRGRGRRTARSHRRVDHLSLGSAHGCTWRHRTDRPLPARRRRRRGRRRSTTSCGAGCCGRCRTGSTSSAAGPATGATS